MQCKDISDSEFLEAVDTAIQIRDNGLGAVVFDDIWAVLSGFPESVGLDNGPLLEFWKEFFLPRRLVRAKAKQLIRKGTLSNGLGESYACFYVITKEMRAERKAWSEHHKEIKKLYELEAMARISNFAIEIVERGGSGRLSNHQHFVYPASA